MEEIFLLIGAINLSAAVTAGWWISFRTAHIHFFQNIDKKTSFLLDLAIRTNDASAKKARDMVLLNSLLLEISNICNPPQVEFRIPPNLSAVIANIQSDGHNIVLLRQKSSYLTQEETDRISELEQSLVFSIGEVNQITLHEITQSKTIIGIFVRLCRNFNLGAAIPFMTGIFFFLTYRTVYPDNWKVVCEFFKTIAKGISGLLMPV